MALFEHFSLKRLLKVNYRFFFNFKVRNVDFFTYLQECENKYPFYHKGDNRDFLRTKIAITN